MLPASSQVPPRPKNSALNLLLFLYLFNKSVISNSFLLEGLSDLLYLTTLLSKKYKPVIARLDIVYFGFSTIFVILFFLFIVATPYNEGFLTGWIKTFAPFLIFVHSISFFVKFWP